MDIIKRDTFENGKHYSRKEYLWESIKTLLSNVNVITVEKLKIKRQTTDKECQITCIYSSLCIYIHIYYIYE